MTLIDVDLKRDGGCIIFTINSSRGIPAGSMCRPVKIEGQWFLRVFPPGEDPPGTWGDGAGEAGVEFMLHHAAALHDSVNLEAPMYGDETMVSVVHKLGLV